MSKQILTAALIAGLASTVTNAQKLEQWDTAGGWDVLIDSNLGEGCLIQAAYHDGSAIRIGFGRSIGEGYVAVFNEAWGDINRGEPYGILFDLDSQE